MNSNSLKTSQNNSSQWVLLNGQASDWLQVSTGVPQDLYEDLYLTSFALMTYQIFSI